MPGTENMSGFSERVETFVTKPDAQMVGNTSVKVVVGSHIQYIPRVELADGTRKDAVDIARNSVKAWQHILKQEGLESA